MSSHHTSQSRSRVVQLFATALLVVLFAGAAAAFGAAPAGADVASEEQSLFDLTNQARSGLAGFQYDPAAASVARTWASQMAAQQNLQHNPNLVSQIDQYVTADWTRLGENIGYGPSVSAIQDAFMHSPEHRANILGDYNRVGIGIAHNGNTIWVAVDFVKGPPLAAPPPPPPPPSPVSWLLRNAASPGTPDKTFAYGMKGDIRLSCDWDGNGTDTPGIFRNGQWLLRNSNGPGQPDIVFNYGVAGYQPICGDWNGDGVDTIGIFTNGQWLLRNSNSAGQPDLAFAYGAAGYQPVVGDWDGNGTDSIGIYVNGTWVLRNTNSPGYGFTSFNYGAAGYQPVVGDWDGNGTDTIGIYVNGTWVLRNTNSPGYGAATFAYGAAGYQPAVGHWNGNGADSIGVIA
jgi:uncharacterized protein YkwD